jgi:hypothetical protein
VTPNLVMTCSASKTNTLRRPEDGAATARFLVLQHERRRRAILGPRENRTAGQQAFHVGRHSCKAAKNSSGETSACRKMPASVPTLTSLCTGTTQPFVSRFMMTWLPTNFDKTQTFETALYLGSRNARQLRHAVVRAR